MFYLATDTKPLLTIINSHIMISNNNLQVRQAGVNSTVGRGDYGGATEDAAATEGDITEWRRNTNLG